MSQWWRGPEFEPFLPYMTAHKAAPDTAKSRVRIEVKSRVPPLMVGRMLSYSAECVRCGAHIHPFRNRAAAPLRGDPRYDIYFAATCDLKTKIGCARGKAASFAYDDLATII